MVVVREITRAIVPCFLAARFNSGIKRLDDISCGLSAQVDLFNYNHLEPVRGSSQLANSPPPCSLFLYHFT